MDLPFEQPHAVSTGKQLPEFNLIIPTGIPTGMPMNLKKTSVTSGNRNLLESARDLISKGLVPIPLRGKIPMNANWQKTTSSTALDIISKSKDANNLGILTGSVGGITVIDIDNSDKIRGSDSFVKLLNEAGIGYPNTFRVSTGGGGTHLYFRYVGPDILSAPLRRNGQRLSIDIKNNGGQIVSFGSIHPTTGKTYDAQNNFTILEMPSSLISTLRKYL